ncbi:hypothetical protein U9R90_12160 [Streptomyces sp. E11-3]|uniref:hypothetical protein n=1 Tax=Streptomyces sp. E11-3 TaxID=3110112 RepID=UPI00397EE77E
MLKRTLRTTVLVAVLATVVAVPAAAAPAPPAAPAAPAASVSAPAARLVSTLKGNARLGYEVAEEEVRVTVDARARYSVGSFPTKSWGTFRISHVKDGRDYWGDFKIDCLTTGGPTATVTGRLVRTSPDHPWQTELDPHTRMGLSFYVPKHGEARVGLSGATLKGEPLLTKCMAPAADMPVVDGGYTLRDKRRGSAAPTTPGGRPSRGQG